MRWPFLLWFTMLSIKTPYSKEFNEYLMKKIKKDLKNASSLFNSSFIFRGDTYTIEQCINSLYVFRGEILFKMDMVVKHLIYNNRQLFWLEIIENYQLNIGKEFFIWKSVKKKNRK